MKQKQTSLLLIVLLFILGSCRKESLPSNLLSEVKTEDIQALKSFYAQNSRSTLSFESFSEGSTMADYMKDSINWDQIKYYPALKTYLVQVHFPKSSTNENFPTLKFLVIRENGQSMTGYMNFVVAAKSTYSGPLTEEAGLNEIITDLENKVSQGITHIKYSLDYETCLSKDKDREIKLGFKLKENNQTNLQGIPEQNYVDECEEGSEGYCIEWFWQTYENGVLIYEEYLYTTCYCGGNGGGGGSNPSDIIVEDNTIHEYGNDDGEPIITALRGTPIRYNYHYQISRRRTTREIVSVILFPTTADPMVAFYIDDYNRNVTRSLTLFGHLNGYTFLSPTAVNMHWNCYVNARYTYTDGSPVYTRQWQKSKHKIQL